MSTSIFKRNLLRISAISAGMLASGMALADAHLDPQLIAKMATAAATEDLAVVVSYKPQAAIRCPRRLTDPRAVAVTGQHALRNDIAARIQLGQPQTRTTPGHVRMVPGEIGELTAVGRDAWRGVEVESWRHY